MGDSLFEGEEEDAGDAEEDARAALDRMIPEDNRGFKLLEKMGWKASEGLNVLHEDPCRVENCHHGLNGESAHLSFPIPNLHGIREERALAGMKMVSFCNWFVQI